MEFLRVKDVLENIGLKDSMSVAEFGCGSADFTIKLARKLKKGRVYALDIKEERISALNGKIAHYHLGNIKTIVCDLEEKNGSKLREGFLDFVLIPNLLFQVENKNVIINEANRILKKGGELLVIDWLKNDSFSSQKIISPESVKKIASEEGFYFIKEFMAGDYHYALLFSKE